MPRTRKGLFQALEEELKKAKEPLDCVALFDKPSIRTHASSPNRVSDYLGNLWRKGYAMRVPMAAQDDRKARWAYVWKGRPAQKPPTADPVSFAHTPKTLMSKPQIEITDNGGVISIELPQLQIVIRPKSAR